MRKLLADFGFSVQSPKRVLALADKEKQAKWTCETYPTVKKKLATNAPASSLKTKPASDKTPLYTEPGRELANNHLSQSLGSENP